VFVLLALNENVINEISISMPVIAYNGTMGLSLLLYNTTIAGVTKIIESTI